MKEKAHSTILLSLDDHIITEVADQATAAELWMKLESLYMTKSLTNKLLLKLVQPPNASILLDLRNLDVKIDDEDIVMLKQGT